MRVITGTARGRNLETLPGEDVVRPTAQRVKEGIFSAIQFRVEGAKVLDLFSGSGQLGIEALSRGAKVCVFVDESRDATAVIIRNLKRAELFSDSRVITSSAERYLDHVTDPFDILFMDPPYGRGTVKQLLTLAGRALTGGGILVCETEKECDMPETSGPLTLKKSYRYGRTMVWIYTKQAATISED